MVIDTARIAVATLKSGGERKKETKWKWCYETDIRTNEKNNQKVQGVTNTKAKGENRRERAPAL